MKSFSDCNVSRRLNVVVSDGWARLPYIIMAAELKAIMKSVGKMGALKVALSVKRLMALTAKICPARLTGAVYQASS